jgi:cytoskeletal protein RodZ
MPSWGWVLIAIAVIVVLALVVWQALSQRRTGKLQQQFGPEYDRTLSSTDSKRDAEAELQDREERRQRLEIRPLPQASRDRYLQTWESVQAQFVDAPRGAVESADSLIQSVMAERGYPVEDFDQRAADISVDHPEVVENYRTAHRLAHASSEGSDSDGSDSEGSDSTEDLRQAMRHYRSLFDELVEPAADEPTSREQRAQQEGIDRHATERTTR